MKMLKEFTGYLKVKGVRSYREFSPVIVSFINYLDELDISYLSITLRDVEDYRKYLIDSNLCFSTINCKINKLRVFYRFLEKRDYILNNPLRDFKGLKDSKSLPKNTLTIDDMGKLLDSLPQREETDFMFIALIELLYGSAIRISEADCLKVKDIDFYNGLITITEVKKDGIRRDVPATETSLRAIKEYLTVSKRDNKEFLFPNGEKTTLRAFVNRRLKKVCTEFKFKKLTTHSFRHSAATSMLRAGAGIREVQAFLGHESILSTEKYTRVIKEDLKKVIRNHHPREVL